MEAVVITYIYPTGNEPDLGFLPTRLYNGASTLNYIIKTLKMEAVVINHIYPIGNEPDLASHLPIQPRQFVKLYN
jgi:hypothetical protein